MKYLEYICLFLLAIDNACALRSRGNIWGVMFGEEKSLTFLQLTW